MNHEISDQPRRRLVALTAGISIILAVLAARVYSIQIIDGPIYEAMATAQQRVAVAGVDSRGEICDRNGEQLTGAKLQYIYILRRDRIDDKEKVMNLLNRLEARERRTSNEKYRIFTSEHYMKSTGETLRKEYGAYIMQFPQRYEENQTAVYVLGYVRDSDGVGIAGLERAYDGFLGQRDKVIYGVADAANRILPGYGVQNSQERSCRLVTTLDRELQKSLEEIVSGVEEGRACIIVTDVKSGEILASAAAPGYDPLQVEELLKSDQSELLNIAFQGLYPPGSVFKIVVAAAALEEGIASLKTEFTCDGAEEFGEHGEVTVGCTSKDGHGTLTLEEAFAESCNCTFIQLGKSVGSEKILSMAERLGFGREVLSGLEMDHPGNLPSGDDTAGPGIANLSIGQGTLLVTPLQVVQMTQIIANDGIDTGLYLVRGMESDSGFEPVERKQGLRVLSSNTAQDLLNMMRSVTQNGTARSLRDWDCGGKTGSAEGYVNGVPAVHAWFTGVVPLEEPQYAVTVFVEGGGSGGSVAVPVFERVLEVLGNEI